MHLIPIIYHFGLILIPLILGFVNRKTKYITRYDLQNDPSIIFLFLLAIVLWPLVLVIGILYGYYRVFVPED